MCNHHHHPCPTCFHLHMLKRHTHYTDFPVPPPPQTQAATILLSTSVHLNRFISKDDSLKSDLCKESRVRVQAELPCVVGKNCTVLQGHYLQIKKVCRHWCHVLTLFHDIYYRQRIFCGPFQKDKSTRC